MQNLHYNPIIEQDMHTLSNILTPLLPKHLPDHSSNLQILNLACGRADETGILHKILRPYAKEINMLGIDIRSREINEAASLWKNSQQHKTKFIIQDASKLFEIKSLKQSFNIAFMRHQNYWNGDTTWKKIYDNALHSLKPNGILIITSYFDREHILAMQAIQSLGAKILTSITNPRSRSIHDAPNKSIDRHIALFTLPT